MTKVLFDNVSFKTSRLITNYYSTSFSLATSLFSKEMRQAIYGIYGFVRLADEIVDAFHAYDKKSLFEKFRNDYYDALKMGISTNPVLNAFQHVVKEYHISKEHVEAFLNSMEADLMRTEYNDENEIKGYIYGSADVVGLMCLKVFCNGNHELYNQLEQPAMKLGSAFQKVNFLRDLRYDTEKLGRQYFPELAHRKLDDETKLHLIENIEEEFSQAFNGIKMLPGRSKLAVLAAYYYYTGLLQKIKYTPANLIINTRIRISNSRKLFLLAKALVHYNLNMI